MIGLTSLKGISRNYDRLTAEERARLILRADGRGDAGEQTRLHHAGVMIELAIRDHTPAVRAFYDVAMLIRIELLDTAALFRELFSMQVIRAERHRRRRTHRRNDHPGELTEHPFDRSPRPSRRELVRMAAHVLRAKFHGWCLFCERISVPPETGPPMGWECLVRDVEWAERWGEASANGEEPQSILPTPMTAMQYAEGAEQLYRTLRARWSGEEDDTGPPNN